MSQTVGLGIVAALCTACTAVGGLGVHAWQEYRVREAQSEALLLRAANEDLVAAKVRAESERDAARRRAAEQREAIYANNADARAWSATPVPDALAARVRDAARGLDAAAAGSGTGER